MVPKSLYLQSFVLRSRHELSARCAAGAFSLPKSGLGEAYGDESGCSCSRRRKRTDVDDSLQADLRKMNSLMTLLSVQ